MRHENVATVAEGLEKIKFEGQYAGAVFAKNLFLANSKKKEQMWLVVAAHDTAIDMKALTKHLKTGSGNLRGGNEDTMYQVLGVKKGSVNLFSILNDATAKKVNLILDKKLAEESEYVSFHPMQNDATTAISRADMHKIVTESHHTAEIVDFSKMVEEAPAAGGAQAPAGGAKGGKGKGANKEEEKKAEEAHGH